MRKPEKEALIIALMDRVHHEYDVIAEIFSENLEISAKEDIIKRAIENSDDNDFGFKPIEREYISLSFTQTEEGFLISNDAGDVYTFEMTGITRGKDNYE